MNNIEIPTTEPTPAIVKAARARSGLTQRQASKVIFGADSCRGFQNWETGARQAPLGTFILFLLMTDQITTKEAKKANLIRDG